MKYKFYHATYVANMPKILREGLKPRTVEFAEQLVDKILAEYGETRASVPDWYWKYPLGRLKETAGRVHLTGDMSYAIQNALAGFEAEAELRSHLESRKRKAKHKYLTAEEAKGKKLPIAVMEIELSEKDIPAEQLETFKGRVKMAMGYWSDKLKTEQQALNFILSKVTITLPRVRPGKITGYKLVGRREAYLDKKRVIASTRIRRHGKRMKLQPLMKGVRA